MGKFFHILLLSCLILLFSGCLCRDYGDSSEYVRNPQSENDCIGIESDYQRSGCYKRLALFLEDESFCNKALEGDSWSGGSCFSELAKMKGDSGVCEKSNDKDIVNSCISDLASSSDDFSKCDKISNHLEMLFCYRDIAVRAESDEVCKNLDGKKKRMGEAIPGFGGILDVGCASQGMDCMIDMGARCREEYADFMAEVDSCENTVSDKAHDDCIRSQALFANAPNLCSRCRLQSEKDRCLLSRVSDGSSLEDAIKCTEILDEEKKANCVEEVAVRLKNASVCDLIPEDSYRILKTNYANMPDHYFNISYRDGCYQEVGIETSDYLSCNLISSSLANLCYSNVAENTRNMSLCFKVSSPYTRSTCVSDFAQEKRDSSICKILDDPIDFDYCIIDYASSLYDSSVCDQLNGTDRVAHCKKISVN